jgi:hypothetical protein
VKRPSCSHFVTSHAAAISRQKLHSVHALAAEHEDVAEIRVREVDQPEFVGFITLRFSNPSVGNSQSDWTNRITRTLYERGGILGGRGDSLAKGRTV